MAMTLKDRSSAVRAVTRLPMAVLAVTLFGLGLAACSDDDDGTALEEAEQEGVADAFVGETITVSGQVERVLPEGGFLIGGEFVSLGYEEGTLVYGTDLPEVSEGGLVQVTGVVRTFIASDIRDAVGVAFDEEDPLIVAYEQEYAIEAETVEFIPEELAEDDETALEEAEEEGTAESMVGETITIGGEVDSIISPTAFRIDADEVGEGTLVLSADGVDVGESGTVEVTGTVVEFVLIDIEEDFDLDFDDDLFVDFDDEFAIVADSVEFIPDEG